MAYLEHIVSQRTQLQSKLHAVFHKESFGSRLAASLTMPLLTDCRGYILFMNFKMGDISAIKYPF